MWNRRTFAKFNRVKNGMAEARSRMEASKPRENPESDWIIAPNTHEPLVPPTVLDRAQELMKSRARDGAGRNFRIGSGLRSPYLLSGLLSCGRCGQNYQGRVVHSTKCRKDGSKIKTYYYACGGYVMKGNSACEKFLLRKTPVEEAILETIQGRLHGLLEGQGELLLRSYIEEEIAAQGADPRREAAQLRARLTEPVTNTPGCLATRPEIGASATPISMLTVPIARKSCSSRSGCATESRIIISPN